MLFFSPGVLVYYVFLLGFFLAAPIIGFSYIRNDATQSGQPGWLWALTTIFMSWIAVLAYPLPLAAVCHQLRKGTCRNGQLKPEFKARLRMSYDHDRREFPIKS